MKSWTLVLAVTAFVASGAAHAELDDAGKGVDHSADMLLIGIPAIAYGLTWVLDARKDASDSASLGYDFTKMTGSPRHDFGLAMARSLSVTYGLKYAVDETRPNGDGGSFPSAHTSVTFTAAEFLRKEYGWAYGIPAYAAASWVGWSRVENGHHWAHDVAAGAAIGILSNHDLSLGWLKLKPVMMPSGESPYKPELMAPHSSDFSSVSPGLSLQFSF